MKNTRVLTERRQGGPGELLVAVTTFLALIAATGKLEIYRIMTEYFKPAERVNWDQVTAGDREAVDRAGGGE